MPYSTIVGMTLPGLASLGFASSYGFILVSVALIGIGSVIFHPEATGLDSRAEPAVICL